MSCARPDTTRSDPRDIGELAEPLRSRIHTMVQDAPTQGLVLVSGFRDPGRQWDLRHDRCPGRECDKTCKGFPTTAVPATLVDGEWVGGSLHQHRRAADMGGRELDWMIEHRAEYGLGLTVPSENWHFEAEGTDVRTGRRIPAPTRRIIPWPGSTTDPEEFTMDAEAKAEFAKIHARLEAIEKRDATTSGHIADLWREVITAREDDGRGYLKRRLDDIAKRVPKAED
jgi:hypothetical protein